MKSLAFMFLFVTSFSFGFDKGLGEKSRTSFKLMIKNSLENGQFQYLRELNGDSDKYELREINNSLITELEEELNDKEILQFILGFVVILLFILIIFLFRFWRLKRKSLTFQKELHHRIKNNLGIIDSFIDVAIEGTKDESTLNKLIDLRSRVYCIYEVHEHVYYSSTCSDLQLRTYTDELIEHVKGAIGKENIRVSNIVPENMRFSTEKTYLLGLIINEFLTNAYKHAFPEKESGDINIFMNEKRNSYSLKMSDSGLGMSNVENISIGKSYGLKLIRMLTKQLGGKLEAHNNPGLELLITLPK